MDLSNLNTLVVDKITTLLPIPGKAIGFELTDTHLKIILIKKTKETTQILSAFCLDIKDSSDEKIAGDLINCLKDTNYKGAQVFLVVSSSLVITTTIQIPSVNNDEIRDILNLQAGRHTPYSREEIVVDYINLGVYQDTYTKALVVMATKDIINKRIDILQSSGFSVSHIFFGADGIGRLCSCMLKETGQDATNALLNLDAQTSDFTIFNKEGLLFTRSISAGINSIKNDKEKGLQKILEELRKSLESYRAEDISVKPACLYISNCLDLWSDLYAVFAGEIDIEMKRFSLADYVEVENQSGMPVDGSPKCSFIPLLSNLIYSQDLRLDLTPDELKLTRQFKRKSKKILTAGILSMVIFFQVCLIFITKIYYTEKYFNSLKDKYSQHIEEADSLRVLSEKTRVVREYLLDKGQTSVILAKLYDILPDEIYLKKINTTENENILISGTSKSMSRIFEFVTELENDKLFSNVKTEYTESRRENDLDVSDFSISLSIEGKLKKQTNAETQETIE